MSYQEKLTGNQLYYLFGLSVLLVYLCLAGQYESWILPLAVLSAVPLALLGPVIALTSLGVANNLYTQIGLILMIALSAKNGILIVEMAREGRIVHGKSIVEAAVDAARLRFRPILMTSFAFGLGCRTAGAGDRSRGERPDLAGSQRVERHHRVDLSGGAVRPLLLHGVARVRGVAQSPQEGACCRSASRRVGEPAQPLALFTCLTRPNCALIRACLSARSRGSPPSRRGKPIPYPWRRQKSRRCVSPRRSRADRYA